MTRAKSIPQRNPVSAREEARLREFYSAALLADGSLRRVSDILALSGPALSKRLSLLRRLELVRTFTVHDPRARRTCQTTVWVRMSEMTPRTMERFEQVLHDDANVVSAQRVAGDCDYRMSCFHVSFEEAARWARALRCRPEIAEVRQQPIRHIFGHELPGMVLSEG